MIIKKDTEEIQSYLSDASNTSGFCDAVYFPESEDDLIIILEEAAAKKIPVTVCGNRTGLTGAAVPEGGFVVSTEKLNRIIEINAKEKYVITEPGVLLSNLFNELKLSNLYYPPDPTETNCFIGGTVATNASGAKSFKYGATRNFVLSLGVCLSTGEIITLNRNKVFADGYKLSLHTNKGRVIGLNLPELTMPAVKNAAGYFCKKNMDAIDLFIGSEGTLGIFTRIKLALLDYPERIFSGVIFFKTEASALNFLTEARGKSFDSKREKLLNKIDATALEFFNKTSLRFLREDYSRIPEEAGAAIWLQQETTKQNEETISELWFKLIEKHNGNLNDSWIAITEKDRTEIEKFRHSISAKVNEYITSHNFRKLGTDIAVPHTSLLSFYNYLVKEVEKEKLDYVAYGHFGDSHIHLNMLPKKDKEFSQGKNLYRKFCLDAIKAGGTFSAEHGVGKNKREYLIEMYGTEAVDKMREIKRKLDPEMILGRGNVFSKT